MNSEELNLTWTWDAATQEAVYYVPVPPDYIEQDPADWYTVRVKPKGDVLMLVEVWQMETEDPLATIDPFDWEKSSKRDDLCAAVADAFGQHTAKWFMQFIYWLSKNHHQKIAQSVREDTEKLADMGMLFTELSAGDGGGVDYVVTEEGFSRMKTDSYGSLVALANFSAHVVRDVIEDDGLEERRVFEVEARLRSGRRRRLEVSAEGFDSMGWVAPKLGVEAAIEPGMGNRDHVAKAIRLYSQHRAGGGAVPEARIYLHTGWRTSADMVDEAAYLHAGGLITGFVDPDGGTLCRYCKTGESRAAHSKADSLAENDDLCRLCHDFQGGVILRGKLARRRFPAPVLNGELIGAVRESFVVWEVAPDEVVIPADAMIKRAVISDVRESVHITGPSGSGKTTLGLILQSYFGRDLSEGDTGSFESTANSLEGETFLLKDQMFLLDDYLGTPRHQRVADRMYRAAANKSARNRMASDGTLKGDKPPRGLILSTGEDLPGGYSLGARILFLRLRHGNVDFSNGSVLSVAQEAGRAGNLARAMAGFVAWLATGGRREALILSMDEMREEHRGAAKAASGHNRTPNLYADMMIGLTAWLDYAREISAIDGDEYERYLTRGRTAIIRAIVAQAHDQLTQDPVERFRRLVATAVAGGRAHVRDAETGGHPSDPLGWGWELSERGEFSEYVARGAPIGYLADDGLYLHPGSAVGRAKEAARSIDEPLNIREDTMGHYLRDGGHLQSSGKDKRIRTRRRFGGRQESYWHLSSTFLEEPVREDDDKG